MNDNRLDFDTLMRVPFRRLAAVHAAGTPPDPTVLAGREYRGANRPATSALLGIRRFVKGFEMDPDGTVRGYNKQVRGASLDTPWTVRRRRDGRVAYAPFLVMPRHDQARSPVGVLLDYGAPIHPGPGLARRLRDVLVRVDPGSDDLLLGRAYLALSTRWLPVGWFILDHLGLADPDRC
jgi:hypothetical protein